MNNNAQMIVSSVSVIFQFNDEVYMVRRAAYLKAFPGFLAFPGGKKEANESNFDTLKREMLEELNFDFEKNEKLILDFYEIGSATAPVFVPYRFTNYFWLVKLKEKINFNLDLMEAEWGKWNKVQNWIEEYRRGEHLIIPPILKILKNLPNINQNIYLNEDYPQDKIPLVPFISSFYLLPILSNTLPPFDTTNAFLINDVLVDPSPKNDFEFGRLLKTFENLNLKAVFLTHHHRDHIQYSNEFARLKKIPIYLSLYTFEKIKKDYGEYFFEKIEVYLKKEGDIITQWNDEEVIVYEVPGHDEGQLALTTSLKKWFIVGDLIQSSGTVVISEPEGDMIKYFNSLEKVIALNPKIILPSHGLPMSGVTSLIKVYEHRKERENNILSLVKNNFSNDEILEKLYGTMNLSELLKVLALKNIESHIKKLKIENRI